MEICILIPCFNHSDTLPEVLGSLPQDMRAIVVDDGSDIPVNAEGALLIRHPKNLGKARALLSGFAKARELGFTHAITIDADGQHDTSKIGEFVETMTLHPDALITGARDFSLPQIPEGRRFMNKFSNFWFRYETGMELSDTQCGYRAYPLEKISRLRLRCTRYAFEAEILVKAAWAGMEVLEIKIPTIYTQKNTQGSHYRPFKDTVLISLMNTKLSLMATFFPKRLRKFLSLDQARFKWGQK